MPIQTGQDTLKTRRTLEAGGKNYAYYSLKEAEKTLGNLARLPFSLKVLLENLLRYEDGRSVTVDDIKAIGDWLKTFRSETEVAYRPARVLMQDFTGVPAVADLAAMREATVAAGADARKINPLCPVDLVIDHSVMIDFFGSNDARQKNVDREFERNGERYEFLKWAQGTFDNFRVVPPGMGICHQINLEYLARTVWSDRDQNGETVAYPDTCVGTDSHTTMINGLSVLGWGVGGIEAEAAMLGQPVSMLIPEVVGFKLSGKLREGITATDLVLTVTQMLRKKGVVGKFVEFYGPGLEGMTLEDRATLANMAPEYGATCGLFPIDSVTIDYLRKSGRDADTVALVEAYAKAQGIWHDASSPDPVFTDVLALDMGAVEASLAGPRLPQGRVGLGNVAAEFEKELTGGFKVTSEARAKAVPVAGMDASLRHGDVVIAAITSCTNTSNPSVLIAAGLVAKKAHEKGLKVKPWVKTSLAPGSQVVTDYLAKAELQPHLDALGFNIVGYGCTTCIGNSGPLPEPVAGAIATGDLVAAAVLSGNRNFEGRVNPGTKANYLASPPLVVAYALAGSMTIDLQTQPLGTDGSGSAVYLRDIWPTSREVAETMRASLTPDMFRKRYADVFAGTEAWQKISVAQGMTFKWDAKSTYVKLPPLFENMQKPGDVHDVHGARLLALLGDSITTDHISPAGDIKKSSPAGKYLSEHGVPVSEFNSYGARRGNHEVMMRGTFANIRIKNELMGGAEGGNTKHFPDGAEMPIYDAAMKYEAEKVPLVVIAGKEYGTGSSRDWAAKGTVLLGVRAVVAESFERIHRSNLVGMGVLPLEFKGGMTRKDLNLTGMETFDITGIEAGIKPRMDVTMTVTRADPGSSPGQAPAKQEVKLMCRIDTLDEVDYFKNGGILPYVLRGLTGQKTAA